MASACSMDKFEGRPGAGPATSSESHNSTTLGSPWSLAHLYIAAMPGRSKLQTSPLPLPGAGTRLLAAHAATPVAGMERGGAKVS